MGDINKLVRMLQELDDNLVSCMRCGMCQAVCPVYGVSMQEADVTRGKIALLENLAHKVAHDAAGVNDKLNRCLLCGSCQANCPSGVKILDIFYRARAIVGEYLGFSPLQKIIFRGMLQHPKLFNALLGMGSQFQGIFVRQASQEIGTSCAPLFKGIIGERHFPRLAATPFHKLCKSLDTPAGKSGLRVAFFPGCVADKMFTGVAQDTVKVLQHYGVGVYLPEGQACCGIPSVASGDMPSYTRLVSLNLQAFSKDDFDYLVTPCATCTATIKEVWPTLADHLPEAAQARIRHLASKAMDITAFLVDVLQVPLNEGSTTGTKVTYHDSCHMKKSLGVAEQPRKLIRHNPNYTLVEMQGADACCGSGGSFTLKHADLSTQIGSRKRENVNATHAQVVLAGCPACMMQLMDMHSRHKDSIKVMHVIECFAETLKP